MRFDAFIGGSFEAVARTADMERTVNWYPEAVQSRGATSEACLLPTPGVRALPTPIAFYGGSKHHGPGRGHIVAAGKEFAVMGDVFTEINSAGSRFDKGDGTHENIPVLLPYDPNPATLSYNGDGGGQIFVTVGGRGYIYDLEADTIKEVVALRGKATMGAFLEGYFLCLDANTSTLYISDLFDGTTWDTGTDFAQRSLQADPWVSMVVAGRYVWLLGELTSEAWYNTGATFPFEPHPSGAIGYGIAAPWSAKLVGSDAVWLAQTVSGRRCVVRLPGFSPEVISTIPLEATLQSYDSTLATIADVYSERGHFFYVLYCDRQGATWAWDSQTGIWCERGTWVRDEGRFVAWRPRYYAYAYDKHRMLDGASEAIYELSSDVTTDVDGSYIRRIRRAPAPYDQNRRVFYPGFELDLEPGLATASAPDPQVMLRLSNDGGKTWVVERWESAGKRGEWTKRVRYTRLGSARRRVFEVSVTDQTPWKLTGCYLTPDPEMESRG